MLLVDAENVLHTTGVLAPDIAGPDLRDLARLILSSRFATRSVYLFCDGPRPPAPPPLPSAVLAIYSGVGRTADDAIEQFIRRSSHPRRILLVTSDRRLAAAARRRRCRTMPSERFLAILDADRHRPTRAPPPPYATDIPLDPHSVAQWMRQFGYDADEDQIRRSIRARQTTVQQKPEQPPAQSPAPPPIPPAEPSPPTPPDPLLLYLLEHWGDGIDLDDLDMRKWLDGPRSS